MTDNTPVIAIETRLIRVVARTLGIPVEAVGPRSSVDDVDGWDSIAQLNLSMAIEKEFGIVLDAEQVMNLISIPVAIAFVKEKLGPKD